MLIKPKSGYEFIDEKINSKFKEIELKLNEKMDVIKGIKVITFGVEGGKTFNENEYINFSKLVSSTAHDLVTNLGDGKIRCNFTGFAIVSCQLWLAPPIDCWVYLMKSQYTKNESILRADNFASLSIPALPLYVNNGETIGLKVFKGSAKVNVSSYNINPSYITMILVKTS